MPISLAGAQTETFQRNGVTIETHDSGALGSTFTDFLGQTETATFVFGTPANNSFTQGPTFGVQTSPVIVEINLATGQWRTNKGTSGTIGAGALTTLNNNERNRRNGLETIANAQGWVTGTVTAWT